ncbi:MAG: transcriptional repressor LexA, partial [Lachnospiraceae bacterium]|nr:transcriptional repressor LexA [Lachnospiraceae bacterium]
MNKDRQLSVKQKQILDFIRSEISEKNYAPSVREICNNVNLKSTSSVHAHLVTLEKKGYIKKDPSKPRNITLV